MSLRGMATSLETNQIRTTTAILTVPTVNAQGQSAGIFLLTTSMMMNNAHNMNLNSAYNGVIRTPNAYTNVIRLHTLSYSRFFVINTFYFINTFSSSTRIIHNIHKQ